VLGQVEEQLAHEPGLSTRKRRALRPNPIAPWQLRLGDVRVFYAIEEQPQPRVKAPTKDEVDKLLTIAPIYRIKIVVRGR
jgi:hypothetical protein